MPPATSHRSRFRESGAQGVLAYILELPAGVARRDAFLAFHHEVGSGKGHGGDLDGYVTVMRVAMDDFLAQSQLAPSREAANDWVERANTLSYNFSATLAECWPDDPFPRSTRHFREGLLAAQRCLAWREELKKGPRSFAIACWAEGVHYLSLGLPLDAASSFAKSVDHAQSAATEGTLLRIQPGADYFFLLGEGYRGLALSHAGDAEGNALFEEVVKCFEVQAANSTGEDRDDANLGKGQLRCMQERSLRQGDAFVA